MTADEFNTLLAQLGWTTSFLAFRQLTPGLGSRGSRGGGTAEQDTTAGSGWLPERCRTSRRRGAGSDGEARAPGTRYS